MGGRGQSSSHSLASLSLFHLSHFPSFTDLRALIHLALITSPLHFLLVVLVNYWFLLSQCADRDNNRGLSDLLCLASCFLHTHKANILTSFSSLPSFTSTLPKRQHLRLLWSTVVFTNRKLKVKVKETPEVIHWWMLWFNTLVSVLLRI